MCTVKYYNQRQDLPTGCVLVLTKNKSWISASASKNSAAWSIYYTSLWFATILVVMIVT